MLVEKNEERLKLNLKLQIKPPKNETCGIEARK